MGRPWASLELAKVMEPIACERRRAIVTDDTEPAELESCAVDACHVSNDS